MGIVKFPTAASLLRYTRRSSITRLCVMRLMNINKIELFSNGYYKGSTFALSNFLVTQGNCAKVKGELIHRSYGHCGEVGAILCAFTERTTETVGNLLRIHRQYEPFANPFRPTDLAYTCYAMTGK